MSGVYAISVQIPMEFIEAPAFSRNLSNYVTDDGYRELQNRLAAAPTVGDVIPGTGGFRKLRWADPRRQKGRRGGLRLIYYYFSDDQQIWLMTLYNKTKLLTCRPRKSKH